MKHAKGKSENSPPSVSLGVGELPDGWIGSPEVMRPRLDLWRRQQAALARGEDPTLIESDRDT